MRGKQKYRKQAVGSQSWLLIPPPGDGVVIWSPEREASGSRVSLCRRRGCEDADEVLMSAD